ncbi:MAG: ribosome assembly cofactor RimP [Bacteroidetes bacterium]|nr:MAG: ribosome assembly cofactor RimP [Bacteroidota bacterium]
MIDPKTIKRLADEFLEGTSGFVVDVKVASGNVIRVALENDDKTSIKECVALSRHIEGSFDREEEDFSLDVGSPGLDQPLKVLRQYLKLIGKQVAVNPKEGKKIEGELISVEDNEGEVRGLVLKTREKKRIEGRKSKQWVEEELQFKVEDLEWTKVIISFK